MPAAQGKPTAVITGATGGFGVALAHRLARDGWHLHLIDLDANRLAALRDDLPGTATIAASDLADPSVCAASLANAPADIHALVHLAGVFRRQGISAGDRAVFDDAMQHNAVNAYDMASAAEPRLADGGRMVFISSLAFNRGAPDYVGYSMAKGALVGLARALSRRLAPRAITVNALAPGIIETAMTPDLIAERGRASLLKSIPLARFGQPDDISGVIAFLLSPDASYITGQLINVDGGMVNA